MNVRMFIIYSRRDAPFALGLQARLSNQGWGAWLDREKLQTGQRWREEIIHTIASCDYFEFVLSSRSIQSDTFDDRAGGDPQRDEVPASELSSFEH